MNNFDFLKPIDKNLYNIICDAEKLYRDEYFEQCITQTRRFGENVCKNVLGNARTTEKTFDDMLATFVSALVAWRVYSPPVCTGELDAGDSLRPMLVGTTIA